MVSIITIFLNAEKFLKESIESVFGQTYDNWELLLIDDGSIDGSAAIAQGYAKKYPERVRYFEHDNHQNRGKSSSRNLGIWNGRGIYLAFLDSDDIFLPQKLERQVQILETHPGAAMVYGPTQYWFSWTGKVKDKKRNFVGKLGVQPNTLFNPPTLLVQFLKNSGTVPCICGLLARRQIVIDVGGFDINIQHMYEDQVLLAKICLEAPVYVESGCWDRYRQHPDSSSHMAIQTGEYHPVWPNPARLTFLNFLLKYFDEKRIKDAAIRKILQRELWLFRHPTLHRLVSLVSFLKCRMIYYLKLKVVLQRVNEKY